MNRFQISIRSAAAFMVFVFHVANVSSSKGQILIGGNTTSANLGQGSMQRLGAHSPGHEDLADFMGMSAGPQPLASSVSDGDVAQVPGAMINASTSATAIAPHAIGANFGSLQASSGTIASGIASVTTSYGHAAGAIGGGSQATVTGQLAPNTQPGTFFAIVYAAAKGNVSYVDNENVTAFLMTTGNAFANAGGVSLNVLHDPAGLTENNPGGGPTLTQTGISSVLVGEDGRSAIGIGTVDPLTGGLFAFAQTWTYFEASVSGVAAVGESGLGAAGAFLVYSPNAPAPPPAFNSAAVNFAMINAGPTLGLEFGDINLDFSIDALDIDNIMFYATRNTGKSVFPKKTLGGVMPGAGVLYDVDLNQVVNEADIASLVRDRIGTEYGDIDLDGDVDNNDLAILNANLGTSGGWAKGNLNGDFLVNSYDLAILNTYLGFNANPALSVPEPYSGLLVMIGGALLGATKRTRR